ncbi:MAG: gamma carbonic anhydrase family protein [Alphaproteobacteria bacterium]|nr:gamma carbonic anhydrase family protein [Alphaproteobacteria bacterium]
MSNFIIPYKGLEPNIHDSAFIAQNAVIIGDVDIGKESSIWFGCILRGDVYDIKIGARTNIQDASVIHTTQDFRGTYIGDDVTIGHAAVLHACTIEDFGFVGMQALVMDGAVIETKGMLAAGAMLTLGKVVPTGQLWAGRPARYMRDLTEEELESLSYSANHYVTLSREYL